MKILNLHGLYGSAQNTNYSVLSEYYAGREDVEIISPQIDYAVKSPYWVLKEILAECDKPDIVVGNSFGGFFAYVFGAMLLDTKTILINPCIPPHEYIKNIVPDYEYVGDLEEIWEHVKTLSIDYSMLLGDSDDVIDIKTTLNTLSPSTNRYTIISGGHRLSGEIYEKWFKEQLI